MTTRAKRLEAVEAALDRHSATMHDLIEIVAHNTRALDELIKVNTGLAVQVQRPEPAKKRAAKKA